MATHTIKGAVKDSQNKTVPLAKISVYHYLPGMRRLLNTGKTDKTGNYSVIVTVDGSAFFKGKPKVQVEALDRQGKSLKISAPTDLSAATVTINIKLDTVPEIFPLSTLLRVAIGEVLDGAEEDTITEQDLPILQEELADELTPSELGELPRMIAAIREAGLSEILPVELFFALPANTTLTALRAMTDTAITTAHTQAVAARRIPELNIDTLLGQIDALRQSAGFYVETVYSGRLLHTETGLPLSGLRVEICKNSNVVLGDTFSNESGLFEIALSLSPAENAPRQLKVFSDGQQLHTQNLLAAGGILPDIKLAPPPPQDTSQTIEAWAQSAGVTLPPALKQHLTAKNVTTLRDLRQRGQLSAGVPGVDANLVKRLDAHAALTLLAGTTPPMAQKLHAKGFSTPEAIARTGRRQFIRTMGGASGIGDNQAGMVWTQAVETVAMTDTMVSDLMINPNSPQTPPEEGDFGELAQIVPEPCTREDCADALSRAAYLADLLDFVLNNVEVNNQALSFATLEQTLFQPFEALPVSCEGDNGPVSQIRLCIEVLRRFLQAKPPAAAAAALLAQQERQAITGAYSALLENLGGSFAELREARAAGPDATDALAQRLGILPAAMNNLLLDPGTFTEADLERVFGWHDTRRAPLTTAATAPEFLTARRDFQRAAWKNEDAENGVVAVDPDLVSAGHLADPAAGPASAIWQQRQAQLKTEYERLKALQQQNAGNNQAALNALLPQNTSRAVLDEKIGASAAAFLKKIEGLIQKNAAVLTEEWEELISILVQFHKSAVLRAGWIAEERAAGLYLNPEVFCLPDAAFDLEGRPAQAPVSRFRAPAAALRNLETTIETRADIFRNLEIQLSGAVTVAETAALPALRTALVMASKAQGANLLEKSRWVARNLLIDAESVVMLPTTRLAQATESLQLLLTALQRGEWQQNNPTWSISLDFFEEKWKWLGSFQTWRAAMMVYLFPENLLYPGLHRRMSSAMGALIEQTRQGSGLNPARAEQLAGAFDAYYKDICNLTPEAAVVAETSFSQDGGNLPNGVYNYLFAKGVSGKIYWTRFLFNTPIDEDDQRLWEEVPIGENPDVRITAVVGAKAYSDKTGKRRIFLFLKTQEGRVQQLAFTTFDLKTSTWAGEITEPGSLPEDAASFEATVKVDRAVNKPPHLFVRLNNRKSVWDRKLNAEGTDWAGDDWNMTLSEALGEKFNALLGVAEAITVDGSNAYTERYVFMQNNIGISYRLFGSYDDGGWTMLYKGSAVWLGFGLSGGNNLADYRVFAFYKPVGQNNIFYSRIKPKGAPETTERSITKVMYTGRGHLRCFNDNWLEPNTGLNLANIPAPGRTLSILKVLTEEGDPSSTLNLFKKDSLENFLGKDGMYASQLCTNMSLNLDVVNLSLHGVLAELTKGKTVMFDQRKGASSTINPVHPLNYSSDSIIPQTLARPISRILNLTNNFFSNRLFFIQAETVQHGGSATGLLHSVFNVAANGALSFSKGSSLLAPLSIDYQELYPAVSAVNLAARKQHTYAALQRHTVPNPGLIHYFYEAYFAMPIQIASQLQRQGHYREALDTYRLVLDYTQPTQNLQKVWAGLAQESSLSGGFERTVAWIKDPLNPHAIAGVRRNAYTRYTLLTVMRCLLDFANAEFARDSAEGRAQAKSLYLSALALIDSSDLNITDAPWEKAVRDMIRALQQKMPAGWESWINDVVRRVRALGSAAKVENAAQKVKNKAETAAFPAVVTQVEAEIKAAAQNPSPPRTLAQALTDKTNKKEKARQMLQKSLTVNVTTDQYTQKRKATEARHLAALTGKDEAQLRTAAITMDDWYKGNTATDDDRQNWLLQKGNLGAGFAEAPGAPYAFCIPDNPMTQALRLEILVNLFKLNNGLNIAGDERPVEIEDTTLSADDLPVLGGNGAITLPATITYQPTPYTYFALIERARQLAGLAQQLESSLLSVLEKRDAEAFSLLRARQELSMAFEQIRLQSFRIAGAKINLKSAEIQRNKAEFQENHYRDLIDEGLLLSESTALFLTGSLVFLYTAASVASLFKLLDPAKSDSLQFQAQAMGSTANFLQMLASNERRRQEWQFAQKQSAFEVKLSNQEVINANNNLRMVNQEHQIAQRNSERAQQVIDFLANKFTNAELFDWMSGILESIYAGTLYMATATARLAEQQLNFERQTQTRAFIQSDYWQPARSLAGGGDTGQATPDRRGMTGSTRLMFDITQLDQHAFTTDERKLQLSKTFSLAQMAPVDFQKFRETGVLPFTTLMEYFDRDFPGHYLRLIQSVQVSIIALVPPVDGVKATLRSNGISRVISGEPQFAETEIRRQPESIAFTSPIGATGLLELRPDPAKLRPFENMGVAATWTLELPKAANQFDYNSIADVFLKIDYTALESQAYREQVVQRLDRNFSADRVFSFRRELSDQWYDLNHPELVEDERRMIVNFSTTRADFPANLEDLKISHLVLFFVRKDGFTDEVRVRYLRFRQGTVTLGGTTNQNLDTVNGVLSTRTGNFTQWNAFRQKDPAGEWELTLPNNEAVRNLFKNEQIEDILFIVTYEGLTPAWF